MEPCFQYTIVHKRATRQAPVPKLRANRMRVDDHTPTRDITSRRLEHGGVILDRSEELWWQLPSFTSH